MTVSRAERSAETSSRLQMASSVNGGLSIRRTIQANVAPPDAFIGLSENNFRFIVAHADRGLFKARKEGYLRRPAEDPLRLTEGRLRPTEYLRQANGTFNRLKRHCQSIAISISLRM